MTGGVVVAEWRVGWELRGRARKAKNGTGVVAKRPTDCLAAPPSPVQTVLPDRYCCRDWLTHDTTSTWPNLVGRVLCREGAESVSRECEVVKVGPAIENGRRSRVCLGWGWFGQVPTCYRCSSRTSVASCPLKKCRYWYHPSFTSLSSRINIGHSQASAQG
jgi:hypothetical protein